MNLDLFNLDLETLKAMHYREETELKARLLNGVPWHEVKDQRKKVTDLAIMIHKKKSEQLYNANPGEPDSQDSSLRSGT